MSTGTASDRIIDMLQANGSKVSANGVRAIATCPAHDDRSPSLSITRTESRALVYCHAGCPTVDVLAVLGLGLPDLFDNPRGAQYSYGDGRIVHRAPDKRFHQSGNTHGNELYRADKVRKAVAAGATDYVVEGEQDVHAVEAIGGIATCSAMGAGKWHKADPSPLHGAVEVVVVADKDDAGERHARDVVASLTSHVKAIRTVVAKVGKDAADHVAAGHDLDELVPVGNAPVRELKLTPASAIHMRPVHWLWTDRMPAGTLTLLGGREGIGKSTVAYWLAAQISTGRLPGRHHGTPEAVIVAATEDSWSHTIVPRLVAAGADPTRIYRVDVTTVAGVDTSLSLPRDLHALEDAVHQVDAGLILLDPLMSRLDTKLDTHKDAEVRIALEPLTTLADRAGVAILGLIHVNKSMSTDPLTLLMGSRAFAAVARSVLFVMSDPDDDTTRLLGQPKNNLGRVDLPTMSFQIESAHVADTDEGEVWTSRITWTGERDQSIRDTLEAAGETAFTRTATGEAADWLVDYLTSMGGTADSATIKREGLQAGHSQDALKRARRRIKATSLAEGFPRRTYWTLRKSVQRSGSTGGESDPTALTALTAPNGHTVGAVGAVDSLSKEPAPTETHDVTLGLGRLPGRCASCGYHIDTQGHHTDCPEKK